jgi:hypothetical protein
MEWVLFQWNGLFANGMGASPTPMGAYLLFVNAHLQGMLVI